MKTKLKDVALSDLKEGPGLRSERDPVQDDDLGRSVRTHGLVTPLLVYPAEGGGYYVEVGGRRLDAARAAGLETVPCVVAAEAPGEDERLSLQLVEQLHRQDLAPVDRARAFGQLMALRGCSQRELADHLSLDVSTVSRALALLELDGPALALVQSGDLAPSTAIRLADLPADEQQAEAETIVAGRVPRRKIEEKKKAPPYPRFELLTPGKWKVQVIASVKKATPQRLLTELQGLVAKMAAPLESEAA